MVDAFAETLLETQEMLNNPNAVLAIQPTASTISASAISTSAELQLQPSHRVFFFSTLRLSLQALSKTRRIADLTALHRMGVACRLCGQFDMAENFYRRASGFGRK
jgi:hypothetical protein